MSELTTRPQQRWFFATNPLKIINIVVSDESLDIDGRSIPISASDWQSGGTFVLKGAELKVDALGGWVDDEHFAVRLREVAHESTLSLAFAIADGTVDLVVDREGESGATRVARLIGGVRA